MGKYGSIEKIEGEGVDGGRGDKLSVGDTVTRYRFGCDTGSYWYEGGGQDILTPELRATLQEAGKQAKENWKSGCIGFSPEERKEICKEVKEELKMAAANLRKAQLASKEVQHEIATEKVLSVIVGKPEDYVSLLWKKTEPPERVLMRTDPEFKRAAEALAQKLAHAILTGEQVHEVCIGNRRVVRRRKNQSKMLFKAACSLLPTRLYTSNWVDASASENEGMV